MTEPESEPEPEPEVAAADPALASPPDAELWRRIQAGDPDAFGLLYARHGPRVQDYVLRRTGDVTAAEDVAAVVFLEAWRRRRSVVLEQPSALPWLFGVASNVIWRWHRSRRRHQAALTRLAALPPRRPELVELQAEVAEHAQGVFDQVRRLPRRERDVLVLSVWEGLSHAEIAAALGIAPGTVKSRLSRARARLTDPTLSPPTPLVTLEIPS